MRIKYEKIEIVRKKFFEKIKIKERKINFYF
jgi:hypothetical protein